MNQVNFSFFTVEPNKGGADLPPGKDFGQPPVGILLVRRFALPQGHCVEDTQREQNGREKACDKTNKKRLLAGMDFGQQIVGACEQGVLPSHNASHFYATPLFAGMNVYAKGYLPLERIRL